jgi:hypothetical protein
MRPPPPGYLLTELGYDEETEAAASLNISPQTLIQYRKDGIGPRFVEVARKIYYSKEDRAEWLKAGGTRSADEALKGGRAFPVVPETEPLKKPPRKAARG